MPSAVPTWKERPLRRPTARNLKRVSAETPPGVMRPAAPAGEVVEQVEGRPDHLLAACVGREVRRRLCDAGVEHREVVVEPRVLAHLHVHFTAVHRLLADVHFSEVLEEGQHGELQPLARLLARARGEQRSQVH